MRISVELVPRSEAEVYADASLVHAAMPEVNAFNIPDLMRFPLRSWDACAIASKILPASIPHIRAIDIPPGGDMPMAEAILASGLSEVLVIRGDPPHDLSHQTYPNTSEDIIRRFKRHHPKLKVFAAFEGCLNGGIVGAVGGDMLNLRDFFSQTKRDPGAAHLILQGFGDLIIEKTQDLMPAFAVVCASDPNVLKLKSAMSEAVLTITPRLARSTGRRPS